MLKKKFGIVTLVCLLCLCVAMLFTACGGTQGEKGDKGESGADGKDGISIVSVEKTDSEGLTDTYTITYSDGKTTTFTVTNGKDGVDGSDGEDGTDGENGISITDAELNENGELVLILSDDSKIPVGSVVGADGVTPHIGSNGHWWIGNKDTGVSAEGKDGENGQDGLTPHIGENGNWFIGDKDTDIPATGKDGQNGSDGKDGISITGARIENGKLYLTFTNGSESHENEVGQVVGADGADGKSAYELYKEHHPEYMGDEKQWLYDLANGYLADVETHTVTFDANGGAPIPSVQEVKHGEKLERPEDPTLDGYVFDGWYYEGEKWAFIGYVVTEDMTLTAQWHEADSGCEITRANGFDIDETGEIPVLSKNVSNATDNYDMVQDIEVSKGCTWKLYADYNGAQEYALKAMPLELGNNEAYIVVFHSDGIRQTRYLVNIYRQHIRNYVFMNGETEFLKNEIEENSTINAPSETPTKDFYDFSHWEVNGKRVEFPYMIKEDTTFTAAYTPTEYSITYNYNEGEEVENAVSYNIETETFSLNAPSRAGYAFAGWFDNAEFSGEQITQIARGTHGDLTLWAKWTANINTLHFNKNADDATGSMDDMKIATDSSAILAENTFERVGYTFEGWATSADGEAVFMNVASYPMGANAEYTLYAVWEAIVYSISYQSDGGEIMGENIASFTIEDLPLTLELANAYKKDYTFMGWYGSDNFEGETVAQITDIGNKTLYARFEYGTEGLIFEDEGGGYSLTGYEGKETDVIVPEIWLTKPVSKIIVPFKGQNLTSLTLPYLGNAPENAQYTHLGYVFGAQFATDNNKYVPNTLKSVTIINGTTIPESAFKDCQYLEDIELPSNLTSIEAEAFVSCKNLTNLHLPQNVNAIAEFVFKGCTSIESITVNSDNTAYKSDGNCLIEIATNKLILGSNNGVIPSYVTEIGRFAFHGYSISSIEIPNSVIKIGYGAFDSCKKLQEVTFEANSQLTTLENGDPLYYWDQPGVFQSSGLKQIILPNSVQNVGNNAFRSCSSLEAVIFEKDSQATNLGSNSLAECKALKFLMIPASVVSFGADICKNSGYPMTIFYGGTQEMFETVKNDNSTLRNGHFNGALLGAEWYYFSETEPIFDGNFWHYIGDIPSKWEWGELKTFHFETNGGNIIDDIATTALTELPLPVQEGYAFLGWYDNAEFEGTPIEAPYYNAEKTTLYAKWEKEKRIHFETNCEETLESVWTVRGELATLPIIIRDGYYLVWYDNAEFTGNPIYAPYSPISDITLYAKWIDLKNQSTGLEIENGMIVGIGTCEDTVLHIYLPIAENAFNNCSQITEVYLYDGCTYIGEQAFNSCSNLKSVYFMQTTMPEISSDVFANTWNSTSFLVFVPQDLYDEYAAVEDTYWQQYIVDANKLYPIEQ